MKTILKFNEEINGFKLIQVNDGFVIVDITKNCPENSWAIFPNTVNGEIENFDGCVPKLCISEYAANGVYNLLIIFATSNLNLEGVPVIKEINSDLIYQKFQEDSFEIGTDGHSVLTAYSAGYKQAQQTLFTEEQVREALRKQKETNGMNQRNQFSYKYKSENEIIQSLKQPKVEITFENNQPIKAILL